MFTRFHSKHCWYCAKQVLCEHRPIPIMTQIALVAVTCGIAAPILIVSERMFKKYTCMNCGHII